MSKKINKSISTYELALMVAKGFSGMDKRFDEFDDKVDQLDGRIKGIESAVFSLDGKVNDVDTRLKKVEAMLEPMFIGYTIMQKEIKNINLRIDKLEKKGRIAA